MTRVLFLDDDPARQRYFWSACSRLSPTCVTTAAHAIALLVPGDAVPWDLVLLDHDLGGEVHVGRARADTGMEVVRHICATRPVIHRILVHSYNEPAAGLMCTALRDAGYDVDWRPFGPWVEDIRETPAAP